MRSSLLKIVMVLLSAVSLASCTIPGTVTPEPVPITTAAQATYPEDLQGAQLYRIDSAASSVHVLVYRGGTMAKMGHNHVISAANLAGYVWQHATAPDLSGFDLVVPVNELIVDDDQARAAQGDDFPLNVDAEAKHGTRTNMLSNALLDGAHFPSITIKSISISGALPAPEVKATLQIKQRTHEITLPVTVETRGQQLQVRGEFDLKQSDFGITPFSVAMDSLYVQDVVKVRFDLVALPIQP